MDNYEIIRPYRHEVYSAKIAHFDIEIDIEAESGSAWTSVMVTSKIGEVIFYLEEGESLMTFEDAYDSFMSEAGIQRIVDLSNERLGLIKQLTKE